MSTVKTFEDMGIGKLDMLLRCTTKFPLLDFFNLLTPGALRLPYPSLHVERGEALLAGLGVSEKNINNINVQLKDQVRYKRKNCLIPRLLCQDIVQITSHDISKKTSDLGRKISNLMDYLRKTDIRGNKYKPPKPPQQ